MQNLTERRKMLQQYLNLHGNSVVRLAEASGVERSQIYKFLSGSDILLGTWEKMEPHLIAKENQTVKHFKAA